MIIRILVNSFILYWALAFIIGGHHNIKQVLYALPTLVPLICWLLMMQPPYETRLQLFLLSICMILVAIVDVPTLVTFNSLGSILLELQRKYPPKIAPDISLSSLLIIFNLFTILLTCFFILCLLRGDSGGFLLDDPEPRH